MRLRFHRLPILLASNCVRPAKLLVSGSLKRGLSYHLKSSKSLSWRHKGRRIARLLRSYSSHIARSNITFTGYFRSWASLGGAISGRAFPVPSLGQKARTQGGNHFKLGVRGSLVALRTEK